jgi:glycosyltransferase involved in cell wall biosynthesis
LGHQVYVVSGPPYPQLVNGAGLYRLPSLDLYNPENLFRVPSLKELRNPINLIEWMGVSSMGFPEPLTFGMRADRFLRARASTYDIIHDNQSLSYGIWAIARRMPTVATIHHPITVDRMLAVRTEKSFWHKAKQLRWYSFVQMQKRVAPTLPRIITVSRCARDDISRDFGIAAHKFSIVPNGIDLEQFYPIPQIQRKPFRLIATASSDTPLKGLRFLLRAIAELAHAIPMLNLVVVGEPKKKSPIFQLIADLNLSRRVQFTGPIDHEQFVRQYASAWAAVIPSVYEGFSLPAGEAMACGIPIISTTGGALPEVVGNTGLLVPPADSQALARAIKLICDQPELARKLGQAGYQRVNEHFTWRQAARKTVAAYQQAIHDYHSI